MKPARKINKYLAIFIGIILAVPLNYFSIPLFAGSELIFGNAVAVAITLLYGLLPGLFVSVVAGSITYLNWGHFLVLLPFIVEIIVIHLAVKNTKNPLYAGIFYWILLGWLIIGIELYYFTDYLLVTKFAIAGKFIINGIVNVMFGYMLANFFSNISPEGYFTKRQHFSQIVSDGIFYTATLTTLLISFFWLKAIQNEKLIELDKNLSLKSAAVSAATERYIYNHQKTLLVTALNNKDELDPAVWTKTLSHLKSVYPTILTLLVSDHKGDIRATAPENLMNIITKSGEINIKDRPYFYQVRDSQQPFISDVFQGRGFGNDPILALSVPLQHKSGFVGILEASLDLTLLNQLDTNTINVKEGLLILDANNRVIYSSQHLKYTFLQDLSSEAISDYLLNRKNYYFINNSSDQLILASNSIKGIGWTIISTVPRSFYEMALANYFVGALLIFFMFLALLFFFNEKITKFISRPIDKISDALSKVKQPDDFESFSLNVEECSISEMYTMQNKLNQFANKLFLTVTELKEANEKKNAINKELQDLNVNLEKGVKEQTSVLEEALITAQKANSTKSDFLATMSHEIRTPMNGVIGMLDLLEQSDLEADQLQLVNVAKSSATSLLSLLNDILDFSKVDAGKIEIEEIDFNLRDLLGDLINAQAQAAQEKGIEIILDVTDIDKDFVKGDPLRIRQIFSNIIGNAVKYTENGEIIIRVQLNSDDQQKVFLTASISDTGIGIAEEKMAELFNPFTQADASITRKYGGTGLGLAICEKLCTLMNGSIEVSSNEGIGSQFTINLQLTISKHPAIENNVPGMSGWNVLIVENNSSNWKILRRGLEKWGSNVLVAQDKQSVIELFDSKKIAINLVIISAELPENSSLNICEYIQNIDTEQNIPLIIMRNITSHKPVKYPSDLNIIAKITKPVIYSELVNALNKVQQIDNLHTWSNDHNLEQSQTNKGQKTQVKKEVGKQKKTKVLLVEDNVVNQKVASLMLKKLGHEVDIAENGQHALEILQTSTSDELYSIILMDCRMPVMDGYKTAELIRAGEVGKQYQQTPIIALTANTMKGDRERCLNTGMNDFLSKPILTKQLQTVLDSWIV